MAREHSTRKRVVARVLAGVLLVGARTACDRDKVEARTVVVSYFMYLAFSVVLCISVGFFM